MEVVVPSVRKFGYLCISHPLVLRKSSVRVRTRPYVRPPVHVSRGEILHYKQPRIATWTSRDKKQQRRFFRPAYFTNLYIDVNNRERARAKDKNKEDQFRWKKKVKIL